MEEPQRTDKYKKRLKILALAVTILILLAMVALAAFFSYLFSMFSVIDDPYRPHAPTYHYELSVTGLDGFTTDSGSTVIMLPIPGANGSPLLTDDSWENYSGDGRYRYHGIMNLTPVNTSVGPMLAARLNMTDYYESYANVTPIAIMPGQNESERPAVVPDRIGKEWAFEDVKVIASGYISQLDYSTSPHGRQAVIEFLESPLLPAQSDSGKWNYTTYVYIDPALKPKKSDSGLRVTGMLTITLNHNKVNVGEEGVRRFEMHQYAIAEDIPGGITGFVPVNISYSYSV